MSTNPSCPTGNLPAAKAYFVTPSPLERRRKRPGISAAWHRRRPGGPSRYSAAVFWACRVTPMRATQGAASSAQATDRSLPRKRESSFPPLGLLSPPNPLRWASAGAPVTASASQWGGRQCRPGLCPACTAHRRHEPPFWGGQGAKPLTLLSPHFFGKKWGPRPGRPAPRGAPRRGNEGTPHPSGLRPSTFPPAGGRPRADDIRPCGPGNGFPHEILTDISKTGCRRRRASSVMSG